MAANFFQPKTAKQRLDEKKQQNKDRNVANKRSYEIENRERSFKVSWKETFPWVPVSKTTLFDIIIASLLQTLNKCLPIWM